MVRACLSLAALAAFAIAGCGAPEAEPGGTLSIRLHSPPDAPLETLGAVAVRISIQGDDLDHDVVQTFALDAGTGTITAVPYGLARTVSVEALDQTTADATVVARGRSLPLDLQSPDSADVDVFVAPVQQFSLARAYTTPELPAALVDGRVGHSVTPLPDGRVLISGGARLETTDLGDEVRTSIYQILDSLEIYDPKTGNVTALPERLTPGRAFHSATRLRGQQGFVLLAGGMTFNNGALVSIALGDVFYPAGPNGGSLFQTENLWSPRARHAATLRHDGSVLLSGGINVQGTVSDYEEIGDRTAVLASAELFRIADSSPEEHGCNAKAWTFCTQGQLSEARADHTAVRVDDVVLAVGGRDRNGPISTTEMFSLPADESSGRFLPGPPLERARVGAAVVRRQDESIVVIGGEGVGPAEGGPELLNTIELYDPTRSPHQFVTQSSITGIGRRDAAAVALDDQSILVAGGLGPAGRILDDAWVFGPVQGGLLDGRAVGPLHSTRSSAIAVRMDTGAVPLAGGYSDANGGDPAYLTSLEIYTP